MPLPIIPANGNIPDTRTTENSNVGLTEKPLPYKPSDPKKQTENAGGFATVSYAIQDGYPNQVHDKRLKANWLDDPYWGKVNR